MSYQYLRYSGSEFHPLFALFTEHQLATEVNVAVAGMIERNGPPHEDKVTGEFEWNGSDAYRSTESDAAPDDDSAAHDGEYITAAVKMFKRVRFYLNFSELIVLTRHPIEEKHLRMEYLEANQIFYGTAEIELSEEEGSNSFTVGEIEIEHDPDTSLPPMVQELKARIEDILNTGT